MHGLIRWFCGLGAVLWLVHGSAVAQVLVSPASPVAMAAKRALGGDPRESNYFRSKA